MDDQSIERITALFDEYYSVMVKQCYLMVGFSSQYASIIEDCVQYAFLQALLKRTRVLSHDNPAGWLFLTARKKLIVEMRKDHTHLAIEQKYSSTMYETFAPQYDNVERWQRQESARQLLKEIFASLSDTEMRVCQLYMQEGHTMDETAAIMHVDRVVVRGAVDRIHRKAWVLREQYHDLELGHS